MGNDPLSIPIENGIRESTEDSGDDVRLLAMAVQDKPQKRRAKARAFNPDPKVADFESIEEVMELWLGL